ncbi:MAG: outer membrane protein transport protein [Xanthomonadales bacterium]|nr:outer membrane protein transport protein [Xanthomonadales bacterium]
MIKIRTLPALLAALIGLGNVGTAFATNGYFTHGTGTKTKGMAGSGLAMPEDAIDVTNNPAVAPFVGDQLIFGAALFSPIRNYKSSESQLNGQFGAITIGPNDIDSDNEYFVIPHISRSWQRANDTAWALSLYGRGGMNTDWKGGTATFDPDGAGPAGPTVFPGTFGAGTAGVNLSQAFLDITWGKKLNDRIAVGISAVLAAQWFKAEGVASFAPLTETFAAALLSTGQPVPVENLSDNGHEWSYGAGLKFGLHATLSERWSLGLMYQTETKMTDFDDYADLFTGQGGFDIPADFKAGLTLQANDRWAFNFDMQYTWYSEVPAVGNPISLLFQCPTAGRGGTQLSNCLGGDNGAGFGWDDMATFKLGARYKAGADWTWRFGYSYGEQPIDSTEMSFNILAPGVIEHHITAGFTLERTRGRQFNMAFMFAPSKSVSGPQNFDPTQTVTFKMHEWEIEGSYSWRF